MSNKISDLTSTQNKPLLVTQQLIEKYYEQILGSSQNIIPILKPKTKSGKSRKDNANAGRVEVDARGRLQDSKGEVTNKVKFNLDTGDEEKLDDGQETATENDNSDIDMDEVDGDDNRRGRGRGRERKRRKYR